MKISVHKNKKIPNKYDFINPITIPKILLEKLIPLSIKKN